MLTPMSLILSISISGGRQKKLSPLSTLTTSQLKLSNFRKSSLSATFPYLLQAVNIMKAESSSGIANGGFFMVCGNAFIVSLILSLDSNSDLTPQETQDEKDRSAYSHGCPRG